MESRIIELEKKISFQDQELKELGNVLMMQHKEIEALKASIAVLKDKAESGALVKDADQEEPPPHY